jgi:hypothetical protein
MKYVYKAIKLCSPILIHLSSYIIQWLTIKRFFIRINKILSKSEKRFNLRFLQADLRQVQIQNLSNYSIF